MKRRSFFTGLFVGAAVTPAALAGSSYLLDENGQPRRLPNGQCPIARCGHMAHPYPFDALQPFTRLVRCQNCSNAFFQDQQEPGEDAPKDTGPTVLELPRQKVVL